VRIGWVRGAGKIGLTDQESGTRGAWVEKRRMLFSAFESHDAEVIPLTPMTPRTRVETSYGLADTYSRCDLLVVEFAGLNMAWYGDDWRNAAELVRNHKGRVLFICDDPDLPLPVDMFAGEDWSRWMFAANAVNVDATAEHLHVPSGATAIDLPLVGEYRDRLRVAPAYEHRSLVYIGRNSGRSAVFKKLLPCEGLTIAGREAEWKSYGSVINLVDVPEQAQRAEFYRRYLGGYVVFDKVHQRLGWRTGRAYHAHAAGVPVWAADLNNGMPWVQIAPSATDINEACNTDDQTRANIWSQQHREIARIFTVAACTIKEVVEWSSK